MRGAYIKRPLSLGCLALAGGWGLADPDLVGVSCEGGSTMLLDGQLLAPLSHVVLVVPALLHSTACDQQLPPQQYSQPLRLRLALARPQTLQFAIPDHFIESQCVPCST